MPDSTIGLCIPPSHGRGVPIPASRPGPARQLDSRDHGQTANMAPAGGGSFNREIREKGYLTAKGTKSPKEIGLIRF